MEGYINASILLKEYNNKYLSKKVTAEFFSNKNTQQLILHIKDKYSIIKPYISRRGHGGATWMHPELYQYFYNWLYKLPNKSFGRDEYEFVTAIETAFNGIYKIEIQKCFDTYKVDLFITELNLVIEFDEKYHKKNIEYDKKRQLYIQDKFNVMFIRHDEKDNIYLTINNILKHAKISNN